jgi:hypothetical protein
MKIAGRRFGLRILELLFTKKPKPVVYSKFIDSFGNFEIEYPKNWRYDKDIAVVDGQYTNTFQCNDSNFTISINAKIQENLNFRKYAKNELESPASGICANAIKSKFRGFPAYIKEYTYMSNRKDYFGNELIFFTGKLIILISWNAPRSKEQEMKKVFNHMLESLATGVVIGTGG